MLLRLLLSVALISAAPLSWACSTCKCGDYTITLMGAEKPFADRLRVSFDYLTRAESAGVAGETEQVTNEDRYSFGASYAFSRGLSIAVRVPYVHKRVESVEEGTQEASGVGDVDVVSRIVLFREQTALPRHLAGVLVGARLPTSTEVKDADGKLLDIDVQPDAKAFAPSLGAWYGYYAYPVFISASTNYLFYGRRGAQNFGAGDAWTASVTGQYAFWQDWAAQLGLDMRASQKNQFSGVDDEDSGGVLGVLNLGLSRRLFDELLINVGTQIPVIKRLNGEQVEHPNFRLGLTYDFNF
jgi:hypothetical protein